MAHGCRVLKCLVKLGELGRWLSESKISEEPGHALGLGYFVRQLNYVLNI